MKIEKLTPEQAKLLPDFHKKWFDIGCSTERADRPMAERAITEMYRAISQPAPRFLWTDSPATAAMAISALRNTANDKSSLKDSLGDSLKDSLRASLWDSLRASLMGSLWDSLGDSLMGSLRASLWDSLGDSLMDSLRDSLWDSLMDSLGDSLRASLWDSLGDSLMDLRFWGQQESSWIAFYKFCQEIGVKYDSEKSKHLDLWSEIAQSCGWWWPYHGLVVCSERPTLVSWEVGVDRPRLHSATGPALAFADGWQVHSWRGLRVPAEWIESPNTVDPSLALTWKNIEQRRALAEIIGWRRVLENLDCRTINKDKDPQIGTLLECDLPDAPKQRFLQVQCGTGRTFVLPVPPDVKTARAANAWTFGLEPSELKPEVRT